MTWKISTTLAILMLVLPVHGQNKAPDPAPKGADIAAPKSENQNFYYHSWAKGEFKVCQTYSGVPNVAVCDSADDMDWKNSLMNMIGQNGRAGMTEEESYRSALLFASKHGKTFLATFSDDPWPMPQTGFRLSVWNCSKDKNNAVSCELGGRTAKPATGE